jgi:hypothetical protein
LDNLVLDIIGRDSVQLTGIGIDDLRPSQRAAIEDSNEDDASSSNLDWFPEALRVIERPGSSPTHLPP